MNTLNTQIGSALISFDRPIINNAFNRHDIAQWNMELANQPEAITHFSKGNILWFRGEKRR